MLKDKDSLDQLIRDVIHGKHQATRLAVPLDDIMQEVRQNTDAGDDEILHWIKLLLNKLLIRLTRPNAYVPVDLDKRAKEVGCGVYELIQSIDEEADAVLQLSKEDK